MASIRYAVSRALLASAPATRVAGVRIAARPALASSATYRIAPVASIRAYSDATTTTDTTATTASTTTGSVENIAEMPREEVLSKTLYLSNLAYELTDQDLTEEIGKLGEITLFERLPHRKGSVRITFKDNETAQKVLKKVNGSFWHGRMIKAQFSELLPGSTRNPPSRTIFIGRIPSDATDAELSEALGGVEHNPRLRLLYKRDEGGLRGFGYADFDTLEHAAKALEQLRGTKIRGRPLYVDYADKPRDARFSRRRVREIQKDLESMDSESASGSAKSE